MRGFKSVLFSTFWKQVMPTTPHKQVVKQQQPHTPIVQKPNRAPPKRNPTYLCRFYYIPRYPSYPNTECWSCHQRTNCTYFCAECDKIQPPPLNVDYFKLLYCPKTFDVNIDQLKESYKNLQKQLHPDQFSQKSKLEQKFSTEHSATINMAFNTLSKPHLRSAYMLHLQGIDIGEEGKTIMSTDPAMGELLTDVLETREQLEEAKKSEEVKHLVQENNRKLNECLKELSSAFKKEDYELAKKRATALQYFTKINQEALNKLETLVSER